MGDSALFCHTVTSRPHVSCKHTPQTRPCIRLASSTCTIHTRWDLPPPLLAVLAEQPLPQTLQLQQHQALARPAGGLPPSAAFAPRETERQALPPCFIMRAHLHGSICKPSVCAPRISAALAGQRAHTRRLPHSCPCQLALTSASGRLACCTAPTAPQVHTMVYANYTPGEARS